MTYYHPKRYLRAAVLAIAAFAIHAFASWCTARRISFSTQFTIANALGIITGISVGLGVYFSLTFQQELLDVIASAGIGVGAFWAIQSISPYERR